MLLSRLSHINLRMLVKVCICAIALATTSFAGSFALGIATASQAEAVPRRVKRACRRDYKTLCPRYRSGTSRMRNCMRANGSLISYRCFEALRDYGYVDGHRRVRSRGRGRRGRGRGRRGRRRRY